MREVQKLFTKGEYVVYGNNGVCIVEEIKTMPDAFGTERVYYVLKNQKSNGVAYVPVDSKVYLGKVMSKSDAELLISRIPQISTDMFKGANSRENQRIFREVLATHDSEKIIALIKYIKSCIVKKSAANKKISSTEERFLQQAMNIISGEFSIALGIDINEVTDYIESRI